MQRVILGVGGGIVLKQYVLGDASDIFWLIEQSREYLNHYNSDMPRKYPTERSVYESILWPKNPKRLRLGIWHDTVLVGGINVAPADDTGGDPFAEVGYWLGAPYEGRGYVARSLQCLAAYAFNSMGMHMLYANVLSDHFRSRRVLERAGFQKQSGGSGGMLGYCLEKSVWVERLK